MKNIYPLFFLVLLFSSCEFSETPFFKDLNVTNTDIVERTVLITPVNKKYLEEFSMTIPAGETKSEKVTGNFTIKGMNDNRYTISLKQVEKTYYDYEIKPIIPNTTKYSILNTLTFDVVLKDKTYPSWSITVPANDTATKEAQLYSDEKHEFYVAGSKTENGFTYIEDGTKKVWYMITVTDNTIVIKEP